MRAVLEPSGLRRYDELNDPQGAMRAHWRPLIERLRANDSPDAVRRSLELTRRLIVENGVTYNVYADPQGADRPWALDPLPFVLPAAEWQTIEAGVTQRARLLNALLADLYGPQRLLAEGLVPAELPFGHPNYLWPCHDLKPVDGTWLHVYAADLARAPDGRWWLLADRTQAPSGAGYALENREILEQVHPEAIDDMAVRRVRGFFGGLRAALLNVAGDEEPLAVILTPGPYNETYFEHAYLARQLGMPLVEGHDLTVRGDTVFLKTLGGLRRVHSILRRLDDDFCDPLELRSDSALGVPGLLGALRAGRVMVANALGTGVLESAAWLGFLPPAAERLIGEKLLLPEVATWWLGEKPALEYVLANLDRLVIKPAYPNQRFEPMFGRDFAGKEREALIERLRNRPYAYVAQEHVRLSRAPVWKSAASTELATRALTMRVYAVATPEGVRVMPGGLARVANEAAADVVSTQRGGGAKDVWVLGDDPHDETLHPDPVNLQAGQVGQPCAPGLHSLAPGREPLLARPLRRALRKHRATAAAHAGGAQRCARVPARAPGLPRPRRDRRRRQCLRGAARGGFARPARRRETPGLVRVAGAQPAVGALLAWRRRAAAADAGGRRLARQQPRGLRARAAVAGRAHRFLRRGHDARRGLARDAYRPAHRTPAVRRRHPGAPAAEPAGDPPRDGRMAARGVRQHAYLPCALRGRAAPVADAEPAAVRRRPSHGAGLPSPLDRSRSRRPGAHARW